MVFTPDVCASCAQLCLVPSLASPFPVWLINPFFSGYCGSFAFCLVCVNILAPLHVVEVRMVFWQAGLISFDISVCCVALAVDFFP